MRLFGAELEAGVGLGGLDFINLVDGINPARGQKDEGRIVPAGIIEAVDRARQVGVNQVVGGRGQAREHGGLGRGLNHGVNGGQGVEVFLVADVAVDELDAGRAQAGQVQLRAAALEVVEGQNAAVGVGLLKLQGQCRAHKAGTARDKKVI